MKKFYHLLLDIEGTVVLDKKYTPVPGVLKWFNSLHRSGIRARLVTNNTTESPENLYRILRRRGFKFERQDLFTCLTEAAAKMQRQKARSCFVIGVDKVKRYLKSRGIEPVETWRADAVLVGLDPTLSYEKMNLAVGAIIENGAKLYTLHRNRRYVNEKRKIVMSSGPIAAALENACMVRAVVCGKPGRDFFLSSIKGWNVPREKILMVSDDPFADLEGAKKLGMKTCWVLTGSQRDRSVIKRIPDENRPDYILSSVIEIPR
jgi:HAD superfamily hydrolase (TIGR01458 family)